MVKIRAASVADISSIAYVDVETWRTAYAGILPDDVLLDLSVQQRETAWARAIYRQPGNTLVAVNEDLAVLGFASFGASRDFNPRFTSQVYTLYVLPDFQGQDIGRTLLLASFRRLVQQGHNTAVIWVVAQNPARFFYERLGGTRVASKRMGMGYKTTVETIGYAWTDLAGTIACGGKTHRQIADDSSSL